MQVAVLGIGAMGAGMARSLQRAGHEVRAWNRTPAKAQALSGDGIAAADTVAQAVDGADAVLTMLYDADSVVAVTEDLVAALGPEAVWLQSATVGPDGMSRIAEAAGDVALLDAPVLGTVQPAEEGNLVPLVSGPADAIDRVRPVLDAIGSKTIVAGDRIGQGSALKLACNAWVLTLITGTAQSIALARAQGVDPAQFLQAIAGGGSDSPYAQLKGKAILAGGHLDASFELDGGRKDLDLIRAAAGNTGVAAELTDAESALFARASERGHGDEDLAAVIHGF